MTQHEEISQKIEQLLVGAYQQTRRLSLRFQAAQQIYQLVRSLKAVPTIGNKAYFFFWGNALSVELAGDWTFWQPGFELHRLPGTPLFYAVGQFPDTACLQYKMIIDGDWQLDPLNSRTSAEGFGVNSELWMPRYQDTSFLPKPDEKIPHGKLSRMKVYSQIMRMEREIFLYVSDAAPKDTPLPLAIIHDGHESITLGNFHLILDNLLVHKKITPLAALFISPSFRNGEYMLNEDFIAFCLQEALPLALHHFEKAGYIIADNPQYRSVIGASLGGLLSTYMVLRNPGIVGTFVAQSPSYWWENGRMLRDEGLRNAHKVIGILQTGTVLDARTNTLRMRQILLSMGATVHYEESAQGHTWGNWRRAFASAIMQWYNFLQERPAMLPKEPEKDNDSDIEDILPIEDDDL